jgi:DNA invertase Pin-like site-specific DNA recombinase
MKVALYLRVSTSDQRCEVQGRELREYCQRRGWEILEEYSDDGVHAPKAGTRSKAPELNRLMKDAAQHRFDAVLVWKVDRFGRSVLHLHEQLQILKSAGVRFLAVSQNIDTDAANPVSGLLLNLLAAFAEFEREMIRERTASGVASARAQGKQIGRPKVVFRRDEAVRMRKEGKSWRAIAKELNVGTMTVVDAVRGKRTGRVA